VVVINTKGKRAIIKRTITKQAAIAAAVTRSQAIMAAAVTRTTATRIGDHLRRQTESQEKPKAKVVAVEEDHHVYQEKPKVVGHVVGHVVCRERPKVEEAVEEENGPEKTSTKRMAGMIAHARTSTILRGVDHHRLGTVTRRR